MTSVTQIEEQVRTILGPVADEEAKHCGFVKRQRQVSGSSFVQGLVFGWMHHPDARVEQLCQALGRAGSAISAPGLSQRFTPEAETLLQTIFHQLVQVAVRVEPADLEVLKRFPAVIVEDSTQIGLPDELLDHWVGCGNGSKRKRAGVKLHVQWDLKSGQLMGPVLTDGKVSDQRSPLRQDLERLPAGSLSVTDNGYFGLQWNKEHADGDGKLLVLTRPRANTAFFDVNGKRLNLCEIGPQQVGAALDLPVLVGDKVRWQARLIMVRVPDDVAETRQERIKRTAQRHSRQADPLHLALAHWTILITNVPSVLLSTQEVVVIQRARWQIERLFRLWKEGGLLDEWRSKKPERIMCELYGKLIGLLLQHWLLQLTCWSDPMRSLVKASKVIRDTAWDLLRVVKARESLHMVVEDLLRAMGKTCRINHRRKHPSTAQLLQGEVPDP